MVTIPRLSGPHYEIGQVDGYGPLKVLPVEELKKAKTVTVVIKHSGKPGENPREFKLKTASQ